MMNRRRREEETMETLGRGALAGLAATVPMTDVIGVGRAAGLMGTPPPVEITENAAEQAGGDPDRQSPEFQAAWLAAHIGYGAACGVIFSAIRPLLPRSDLAAGLLFGGAVWGVSYIGLMPSLNLYPSAEDDSNQRQAVMIAAHAVFGTALASFEHRLRVTASEDIPVGHVDSTDQGKGSGLRRFP
jgi:putative membrane protein